MSDSQSLTKHNELTFQLMVDAAPSALILVNKYGKIAYVNTQAESLFMYHRTELIGNDLEMLLPQTAKKKHLGFVNLFFLNPQARVMGEGRELYACKKDGSVFPVEIGLNPIATIDGTLVLAGIIDITERKKASEQLRLVFEAAPTAMIMVNDIGTIQLANKQTQALFGYTQEEIIGQKIELLIPQRYAKQHVDTRNTYLKKPSARIMGEGRELYGLRKDGSEFPIEIGLNPIDTANGKMVSASIIDITNRKKIEEERQKYTHKLETKNKELEQFTYIASHDLQEPVRSIGSLAEILIEDYGDKLDDTGQMSLEFLKNSANRMRDLIKSLLDYSRLGQKNRPENVDVGLLLESVVSDLGQRIKETKASIEIGEMPTMIIYETEVRLLFQNLISNALKFRKPDISPQINIHSKKNKEGYQFTVKDNGIGIEEQFKEKIFVIFQRLHKNEQYEGMGIGLSHCKKIVELHDGKIWAESEYGQGSEFHFTINKHFEIT
ncbi:PAS domain S-box protein [Spongiivirga sp. MCCC 1A20706]|uniref:PAS domain-containing sensor histidine kinase n=1 Tax=Spongiivirga sp. MCCC 1A20706 TaxID=3160963 RepID=UPI003977B3BB